MYVYKPLLTVILLEIKVSCVHMLRIVIRVGLIYVGMVQNLKVIKVESTN